MVWLITSLFLSAQPVDESKNIYVAPPTIHDEDLEEFQSYINSLLVSSSNVNKHWVQRTHDTKSVFIYDKHTIEQALDTVCNYNRPLECGSENYHWVLVTDIFTTKNFATIVVKLYDENTQLLATSSKSSYSVERCKQQVKETIIKQPGRPPQQITEKLPDKCITLKPSILSKDIKQVITILFASIHPVQ